MNKPTVNHWLHISVCWCTGQKASVRYSRSYRMKWIPSWIGIKLSLEVSKRSLRSIWWYWGRIQTPSFMANLTHIMDAEKQTARHLLQDTYHQNMQRYWFMLSMLVRSLTIWFKKQVNRHIFFSPEIFWFALKSQKQCSSMIVNFEMQVFTINSNVKSALFLHF